MEDRDFVDNLGVANIAPVEIGKMAVEQAANADVRKFGQMMVDDHTKAGERLMSIATGTSFRCPRSFDFEHRDLRERGLPNCRAPSSTAR